MKMLRNQCCLRNKGFCLVWLILSSQWNVGAQSVTRASAKPTPHIVAAPLDIGDKVPDVRIDIPLNYTYTTEKLSLIDETGLSVNIDIDLPFDISNIQELNQTFNKAGFLLNEVEKEVEIIVIGDSK